MLPESKPKHADSKGSCVFRLMNKATSQSLVLRPLVVGLPLPAAVLLLSGMLLLLCMTVLCMLLVNLLIFK